MFFTAFYLQNRASMRNLFQMLPLILSFFIPALTMRVYAEEKRVGSIETLYTLPVTEFDVAAGKFLATFAASAIMIAPTLLYLFGMLPFGAPDAGPVAGGYIGALFLCAAFSAIGIFASSITKNQIISFFTAFIICISLTMVSDFLIFLPSFIICISLTMVSDFLIFLPAPIVGFLQFLSANEHFTSISRGIIDSRDIIYFVSLTALFFSLTVVTQEKEAR